MQTERKKKEHTVINTATKKPTAEVPKKETNGLSQKSPSPSSEQLIKQKDENISEPPKHKTHNSYTTTAPEKTNKKSMPGFSIKEALDTSNTTAKSTDEQADDNNLQQKTDEETAPRDHFSQETLSQAWEKYAASLDKSKERLYNTMKANTPKLNDAFEISFEVNNPLQIDQLNKIKPQLLTFLHEELNNKKIRLHFNLVEENEENQAKKLYTPEDKYKHMTDKNPKLDDLRQQFNLDFE
ncbi:MAG: hypothetical protein ACOC2F_05620 [Bacteroidota bacterium]